LDLKDVLTPLSSLPQLRSLSLGGVPDADRISRFVLLSDLALLSSLRSLRSLSLDVLLPFGSLSLLCSLPLERLDLSNCRLIDSDDQGAQDQQPAPAAPLAAAFLTLRRLHLPEIFPFWRRRPKSSECWRPTA
jgi:hypothetical protein